jgi:hypothetical protein
LMDSKEWIICYLFYKIKHVRNAVAPLTNGIRRLV